MYCYKVYFFTQLTEKTGGVNKISIKIFDSGVQKDILSRPKC